jgi:hypothetical protein
MALCLIAAVLPGREPRYEGLTMGQWLGRLNPQGDEARQLRTNSPALVAKHYRQADEALLVLGTNNLPLLLERLRYDHQKDFFWKAFNCLPEKLRNNRPRVLAFLRRRSNRAHEANRILQRLGTNAAPAIPALARMADESYDYPCIRALAVLCYLGDEGLTVVAAKTVHTNRGIGEAAVGSLLSHTGSKVARSGLTNALRSPNPEVQRMAWHWLTNRYR